MSSTKEELLDLIKTLESQMLKLITDNASMVDGRWASIAKTHFQEGTMALERAVKDKV